MVKITLPNGRKKEFKKGITPSEIAKAANIKESKAFVAARVNGEAIDLHRPINKDSEIKFLTFDQEEGRDVFRHSGAHVMAQAVLRLYPQAQLTIGPVIEDGFYYDIAYSKTFTPEDLKNIEKEMKKIVNENHQIKRKELTKAQAMKLFGKNPFKKELINEFKKGDTISAYEQGEFVDLCSGPHLPRTGMIKGFKLTKVAGAYWRADSKNQQLQRIYGVAFPDKKLLNIHLKWLEEAEKRDHRKLGKQLDLFSFREEGPGFPFFHPKGTIIKNELIEFWRDEHIKAGYQEISTPQILSMELWKKSGHWDHYKEHMYFTKVDEHDFAVKPMNCPGAMLVYKSHMHSYKELPFRLGELGVVHRHELSGVVSGLFRVRNFTQDDAHIFVTPEQLEAEILNIIKLTDKFYKVFGFEYHLELSTRPEKAMGEKALWDKAEKALENSLRKSKIKYNLNPGDGAFYGPKIDFHIKDALGRTWQCGTVQVDFQMPEKFGLSYEGKDGKKHVPVVIHRVIYGSLERFIGILIEHYAGRFPLWFSPEQVRIITVAERFKKYADQISQEYSEAGIRSSVDSKNESVSYKVRDAQLQKVSYILVVGDRELKNKTVTVRTSDGKVVGEKKPEAFLKKLLKEIENKG